MGILRSLRDFLTGVRRCEWCGEKVDLDIPGTVDWAGTAHCNREHLNLALDDAR